MADRPILFSPPMVRALLDGRKTQTRRVLNPQPVISDSGCWQWDYVNSGFVGSSGTHIESFAKSAGSHIRIQLGDLLWVREAWRSWWKYNRAKPSQIPHGAEVQYVADDPLSPWDARYRPAMFMPKWASRITLLVTGVKVERLNDISEEDAIAEGIEKIFYDGPKKEFKGSFGWKDYRDHPHAVVPFKSPIRSYESLWDRINGDGAWAQNPWVVAYRFDPIFKNINEVDHG